MKTILEAPAERTRQRTETIGGDQSPLSISLRDEIYDLCTVEDRPLAWLTRHYKGTYSALQVQRAVNVLLADGRLEFYSDRCGGRVIMLPLAGTGVQR